MEDLSLHMLDIMENSLDARARRIEVRIDEDSPADRLILEIRDDGNGMDARTLEQASNPFFTTRTTRKFGLGLSMLAESAKATGGVLTIDSAPGRGTRVKATFRPSHIDMKPLGDIPQTLLTLLAGHPEIELRYEHVTGEDSFSFDTREIRGGHGSPEVLRLVEAHLREGLAALTGRTKTP
ncbi:MAG: ATP-binding protein [Deltaproteobacteria bacterium]|jgi:hypothetical protein|nr:ATP-binding protein [Deltaproteobacteria bacterium]